MFCVFAIHPLAAQHASQGSRSKRGPRSPVHPDCRFLHAINAVSLSSGTTKRFPSPQCASAIQIVRPLEPTVDRNRAGSRWLFLAEFLESGIATQRVPLRMEP